MSDLTCALCDIKINQENDSKEHIIPNAIGGKKKIKGFICNPCNNTSGAHWDVKLTEQLNTLCLLFGIIRDRGTSPSQLVETTGGEKFRLNADGSMDLEKPTYRETPQGREVEVQIQARSMKEAQTLAKMAEKNYPNSDVTHLLKNLEEKTTYLQDMIKLDFSIGGKEIEKSLIKSAIAMAFESNIDPQLCIDGLNYLRGKNEDILIDFFHENDLIKDRPQTIPFHCISIDASRKRNNIIGYIEYFGIYRVIILLSRHYQEKSISKTYAIDPTTGTEINLKVDLNISTKRLIKNISKTEKTTYLIEKSINNLIPSTLKKSLYREKNRVIHDAIKSAYKKLNIENFEELKPEQISEFTDHILESMRPFLRHISTIKNSNKNP